MPKLITYLKAFIASVLILLTGYAYYYYHLFHEQVIVTDTKEIMIPSGQSIVQIAHTLKKQGILPHPTSFIFFTKLKRLTRSVHAGEFQLKPGITAEDLLTQLVEGRVMMRDFTLVEGWRFSQVLENMHSNPYLLHDTTNKNTHQILKTIDKNTIHPEGRFFPETYHFARGTPETQVLSIAFKLMQAQLALVWPQRDLDVPYKTPYDALIVASLIEKETAFDDEKAKIAGVIIRRLKKRMPLQIDPTVIYGLGKQYNGKLSKKNLKDPHVYNTYKYKGLPPTPIAMPGLSSIKAALHPAAGDSLYFVAKGDGSHVFSSTLKEHQQAVNQLKRQRQQTKG